MTPTSRMKTLLNDFAVRSFRDTADGDYIAARTAFRCTLYQQFFWSSQQAMEKYLKCILLLNRTPATTMRHDLCIGLAKIKCEGRFPLRISPESLKFLEHLSTYGSHRYFETSYYSLGSEIFVLDRAVWEMRRYCTVLNYSLGKPNGEKKEMLEVELRRIEQSENDLPQKLQLQGGYLEKVIRDKEHPARKALIWKNLYFGKRRRRNISYRSRLYSANAPLALHPEIIDEVQKYVLIPEKIVNVYRKKA